MKLNKRGWDLQREVFYIIIFAVCLIIAIIGIVRMNLFMGKTANFDDFDYSTLENKLIEASRIYIESKDKINNDEVITSETLIEKGYLNSLEDGVGEKCSGYVSTNITDTIEYKAYISCFNYTTSGYNDKKDN